MNDIRYLLDENVNPLLRTGLLRHEPELVVWRVGIQEYPLAALPIQLSFSGVKTVVSSW